MNFLAHCALARDFAEQNPELGMQGLLAGAVIGDFIKGPVNPDWPADLVTGIRLHRRIDALSNQDPAFIQLSEAFPAKLRRFAPIFVDLLLDHALALEWRHYYDDEPNEFSIACYSAIDQHRGYLPSHGERFFSYMQDQDLLARYSQWQHVADGASSVVRRLSRRRDIGFTSAEIDMAMQAAVAEAEQTLTGFYPEFRNRVANTEL